jgi:hypothetical protein
MLGYRYLFCRHHFSPLNTFMRKRKDPEPDPDPPHPSLLSPDSDLGGPKAFGSPTLTLSLSLYLSFLKTSVSGSIFLEFGSRSGLFEGFGTNPVKNCNICLFRSPVKDFDLYEKPPPPEFS